MRIPRKFLPILMAALLSLGLVPSGQAIATIIPFTAMLDGAQETPPNASPGTGSATLTFDTSTSLLSWAISWSGLLSPVNVVHFHTGPIGVAGPVLFIPPGNTSPEIGNQVLTASQASDLLAGLVYINLHTNAVPSGEIRGQVQAPEPAALLLLASGIAAFSLMCWISRRRIAVA